jgi:3-keto-L-gulonate-6-phosphate decarboxylase
VLPVFWSPILLAKTTRDLDLSVQVDLLSSQNSIESQETEIEWWGNWLVHTESDSKLTGESSTRATLVKVQQLMGQSYLD